jgi:hypothetical protein
MDNPNSANPPQSVGLNLRRRRSIIVPIAVAFAVAIVLWVGTYHRRLARDL